MFFFKTLIVTVLLMSLLQIKAGDTTLENHATHWIRTTSLIQPLHSTAEAGVTVIRDSAKWLSTQFQRQTRRLFGTTGRTTGERLEHFKLKRSDAFEEESKAKQESAL